MKILNILFLVGWLLAFMDDRYKEVSLTQFQDLRTLALIAYVLFVQYLMFQILNNKIQKEKIIFLTAILYSPALFVLMEFIGVILGHPVGHTQPPTIYSHLSGFLIGIIPIVNIAYLLSKMGKKKIDNSNI